MKRSCFAISTVILLVAPCHAEEAPAAPKEEIMIGGGSAPAAAGAPCVDVQIGNDRAFGCLNQQLRREVDKIKPLTDTTASDARSTDLKTGVVNIPAIRQQYGRNFGVSAVPYRDPAGYASSPMRR